MSQRKTASGRNRRCATLFAALLVLVSIQEGLCPVTGNTAWAGPHPHLTPTQLQHLHFRRAETLYRELRFREALAEYKKALEAKHHPAIVFNIAQCYRQLGDWKKALLSYKLFLSERPNAPNRAEVEQWIRLAKQKIAEEQAQNSRGRVSVITTPAGAAIRVDQPTAKPVASSPATLTLSVGPHVLFFTKLGYKPAQRVVTIKPQSITTVNMTLAKLQTAPLLGKVSLVTRPAGANVFVDSTQGRPAGSTPVVLRLTAGKHVIVFTKKGYQPFQMVVTLQPRAVITKTVTLQAAAPLPNALALKTRTSRPARKVVKRYVPYQKRWWFKTGVSLASVFAALGIASGSVTLHFYRKYWAPSDSVYDKDTGEGIRKLALMTDCLFAAALVTAVGTTIGAIVIWKKHQRRKRKHKRLMLAPNCGPNGCGVVVFGEF